jgi:hypothetical protein
MELAWAVLLMDVIILLTGVITAQYVGRPALRLAAAFAILVSLTMTVLAAANLLLIGAARLGRRRALSASAEPHSSSSTRT